MKPGQCLFLSCMLMLFSFTVKAQQTITSLALVQKAKRAALQYIRADALFPKSYLPVKWSELSALHTMKGNVLLKKTDDESINTKIDSLIALETASGYYPEYAMVYTILHAFKLKTHGAGMVLKVYNFHLDENMNIIDVDSGSPEDQIEKNKQMIERAEQEKILIKAISEMEIANLKK